ncbi:DUF5990 family protein [Runella sp.]|uniref:DUF5990 family protein n=1 Tax=Runella sp. TaxID=1960881 RepID=UPI00262C400E|nr:DUF5990 family protein [Runella sp.]
MEREITLRIILEKPTAGVVFGIQEGNGNNYVTIQKQQSQGEDLTFEFSIKLKSKADELPVFLGVAAQGPPKERFVYIDIGRAAGQMDTPWSRRLKIPLKSITWELLYQLEAAYGSVLEVRVPGVGKDGGPNCASVKLQGGWKLIEQ